MTSLRRVPMLDGHNDVLLRLYRRSGIAKHRYTRHAGRNLLEQFHPLSAHAVFEIREPGGIASRPRQAFDQAGTDRVGNIHEHDWDRAGRPLQGSHGRAANGQDRVRRERNQFRSVLAKAVGIATGQANVDLQVSVDRPAQLMETLLEHRVACLCLRVVRGEDVEYADAPHWLGLLRARRTGHAVAPPRSVMNSRRLTRAPHWLGRQTHPAKQRQVKPPSSD
jgi:hypothetical protein